MMTFKVTFRIGIFCPKLLESTHLFAGYGFGTTPGGLKYVGEILYNHAWDSDMSPGSNKNLRCLPVNMFTKMYLEHLVLLITDKC